MLLLQIRDIYGNRICIRIPAEAQRLKRTRHIHIYVHMYIHSLLVSITIIRTAVVSHYQCKKDPTTLLVAAIVVIAGVFWRPKTQVIRDRHCKIIFRHQFFDEAPTRYAVENIRA